MSHATAKAGNEISLIDAVSPDLSSGAMIDISNNNVMPNFLTELKDSWVYGRTSAFRMSTFSTGRHSTTWSCLSTLRLSQLSEISVYSLMITENEVINGHRLSQTWSNDQVLPKRSSLASESIPKRSLAFQQHLARIAERRLPIEPLPNEQPYSEKTVKPTFRHSSNNSASHAISTNSPNAEMSAAHEGSSHRLNTSVDSPPDWPLGQYDQAACSCTGCGEVSRFLCFATT